MVTLGQSLKIQIYITGKINLSQYHTFINIIFDIITAYINKAIETGNFPDSRKMANVTPVFFKKGFS